MTSLEQSKALPLEERAHRVFGEWALEHTNDGLMSVRKYDPRDPYHNIEEARVLPEPDLKTAERLGRIAMGDEAFDKLSDAFKRYRVVETGLARHAPGQSEPPKSTLITTLHLKNVLDTPITHNNLFVTSGGSPEIAEINDIIANPMMSRLALGGIAVYQILAASGGIDEALPTEGAAKYGMRPEDISFLEKIETRALKARLQEGVIFHWSLPGTRAKKIGNRVHVKRVPDGIANIVRKRLDLAVPVPMDVRFGDTKLEVLEPRTIRTSNDVHVMMEDMVEVASELTGVKVIYGLPGNH